MRDFDPDSCAFITKMDPGVEIINYLASEAMGSEIFVLLKNIVGKIFTIIASFNITELCLYPLLNILLPDCFESGQATIDADELYPSFVNAMSVYERILFKYRNVQFDDDSQRHFSNVTKRAFSNLPALNKSLGKHGLTYAGLS
jgi:hypothetical protein